MNYTIITIPLLLAVSLVQGEVLNNGDSLCIDISSEATIRSSKVSGNKAWEGARAGAAITHAATEKLSFKAAGEGYTTPGTFLFRAGHMTLHHKNFSGSAGYFTEQFGVPNMYNHTGLPLPCGLIWNCSGFGYSVRHTQGRLVLAHSSLLNNLESGAIHGRLEYRTDHFCTILVGGVQSYDIIRQDNLVLTGSDLSFQKKNVSLRSIVTFIAYFGYGNTTMLPGNQVKGRLEFTDTLSRRFILHTVAEGDIFRKSYTHYSFHSTLFTGFQFPFHVTAGPGADIMCHDDITTISPYFNIICVPSLHSRIVFQCKSTGTLLAHPVFQCTGGVWFVF
jgi:hypothetical protein